MEHKKLFNIGANSMEELTQLANEMGIEKDEIVNILQTADRTYIMTYWSE